MTEQNAAESYRISPWTAEFIDPKVEAAMQARLLPIVAGELRVVLWVAALLVLSFMLFEFSSVGAGPLLYALLATRVAVAGVLIAFAVVLPRRPAWILSGWGVSTPQILAFMLAFTLLATLPEEQIPWLVATIMMMLFGAFAYFPNRLIMSCGVAAFGIVGTLVAVVPLGLQPWIWAIFTVMLLIPVSMGFIVAYRYKIVGRKAFAHLARTQQARVELEKEIDRRRQLEETLREQASTDPLTGLFNRRHYEALFEQELTRAQIGGVALTLCVLDIDHFKRINDTYGHSAGDQVLCRIAEICRGALREMDVVGRLGGEEFVIMLPDTPLEPGFAVAERLRKTIADTEIVAGQERVHVTVSIGVSQLQPDDQGIDDLVRRTDVALYSAKRGGRNRTQVAG